LALYRVVCECGNQKEVICSYDKAKNDTVCDKCGLKMSIGVVKGVGFKIFGYSADNNYSMDNMSYDGNPNPTW
jgi:transcription elongation factor Elf1